MSPSPTKSVRILYPIFSPRGFGGGSVTINLVKPHIGPVHDIQTPQRGILDEELLDCNVRYVPEYKRHGTAWLRIACFCSIPGIAIAVNAPCSVAVNLDVVSSEHERSPMVLEGDVVGIVAPVVDIVRELSLSITHGSFQSYCMLYHLLSKSLANRYEHH